MMKKIVWFLSVLIKSFSKRKARVFLLIISICISTILVVTFLAVYTGVRDELGKDLRAFGANMVIEPFFLRAGSLGVEVDRVTEDEYLEGSLGNALLKEHKKYIDNIMPVLEGEAKLGRDSVGLIGLDSDGLDLSFWNIRGETIEKDGEVIIGVKLAERFGLDAGERVTIEGSDGPYTYSIKGISETGTAEDEKIIMDLKETQELLGLNNKISRILVGVNLGVISIEEAKRSIEKTVPEAEVRSIEQVAQAEKNILDKIKNLLLMVTIIVVLATGVGVSSTYSTVILERGSEIGLLKALGSTKRDITLLFITENILISVVSALLGFGFGFVLSEMISLTVFNVFIGFSFLFLLVALAVSLLISFLSTFLTIKRAVDLDAALTLKGL